MVICVNRLHPSLRIKHFRVVGEQKETKERYFARAKIGARAWPKIFAPEPPPSLTILVPLWLIIISLVFAYLS